MFNLREYSENKEKIMPLATAYPFLEIEIKNAFEKARKTIESGAEEGTEPKSINDVLAQELAAAIHKYVQQAVVTATANTAVVGVCSVGPVVGTGFGVANGKLV